MRATRYTTAVEMLPEHRTRMFDVFHRWQARGYTRANLVAVIEEGIANHELDPAVFDLAELARGGRPLSDLGLYGRAPTTYRIALRSASNIVAFPVETDQLGAIGDLVRTLGQWSLDPSLDLRGAITEIVDLPQVVDALVSGAVVEDAPVWPVPRAPGIYRREHASLVLRSKTTTLLLDPQLLASAWTTANGNYPGECRTPYDAVLLTHGHNDHWHSPSILQTVADAEKPVIVPHSYRSILTDDVPHATLSLLEQSAIAATWGETHVVGDFTIDVLPFYGEQPTVHGSGLDEKVRNWGNTYRFTCPEFSALILVDSGVDAAGSMVDVLEQSVAQRGPVDILLSCCHEFPEGVNPGLPEYTFVLPFERVEQILAGRARGEIHSMTLGPRGLVDACAAARARYFLPYAHGFNGVGREPEERDSVSALASNLAAAGSKTALHEWWPGDSAHLVDGTLELRRVPR